jgi:hypothetical protein
MNAAPSRSSYYFVNAPVDFFFIGGASIGTFILMSLFYTRARTPAVIATAAFLVWTINWPHFSMTIYRLYQSKSHMRQYPFTAYMIPFVIVGGVALSFAFPELVAPYFVKLFIIWSPYHFSGQTIGITLIYARRCGIKLGHFDRQVLTYFVYGTFLLSTMRAEVSRASSRFYGVEYPAIGIPEWLVTLTEYGLWAALVVFMVMVLVWCYKNRRLMPAIVLLPAITQYVWFILAAFTLSFQEFVPMFHSLQYMLIAWGIQLKEKMDLKKIEPAKRYAVSETARWSLMNFMGGAILFYLLPRVGAMAGYSVLFSTGVVIAGVQIHHFFVDGVIWKLRNQTVAHPLMMTLHEVVHAGQAQEGTAT